MCGIAGQFSSDTGADRARLLAMAGAIAHRGPDAEAVWIDGGLGLAHRRLAVLDPSAAGAQPMGSACGRYVIVFNGEIYNHLTLRDELPDVDWRGHADTETLLAALAAWGIESTLARITGMFAFALWDRARRELTLARDRMGEKPLYYGWQQRTLLFASELGALRAHPAFERRVDQAAARDMLRFGHVVAPRTIHTGIRQLLPGHWITISLDDRARVGRLPATHCYWSPEAAAIKGLQSPLEGSDVELADAVEAQLAATVAEQRVADVPVGVFLSGGIDSSLITSLLAQHSGRAVKTFTIAFDQKDIDESAHARRIAEHLGCEHHEIPLRAQDAMALVPTLASHYDEPFSDPAALPMLLMCRAARKSVTVALGGDGGDEVFGGYPSAQRAMGIGESLVRIPGLMRRAVAATIDACPSAVPNTLLAPFAGENKTPPSRRLRTLASLARCDSSFDVYCRLDQHDPRAGRMMHEAPDAPAARPHQQALAALQAGLPAEAAMALAEQSNTLPNRLLSKVDRAAMAASLETRSPLLDHRLVELGWRIPMHRHHDAQGAKRLLRAILARHLPRDMFERPKAGFSVPIALWLRGPLREWAESLLAETALKQRGLLRAPPVRSLWLEHLSGQYDHSVRLWDLLSLMAWAQANEVCA